MLMLLEYCCSKPLIKHACRSSQESSSSEEAVPKLTRHQSSMERASSRSLPGITQADLQIIRGDFSGGQGILLPRVLNPALCSTLLKFKPRKWLDMQSHLFVKKEEDTNAKEEPLL